MAAEIGHCIFQWVPEGGRIGVQRVQAAAELPKLCWSKPWLLTNTEASSKLPEILVQELTHFGQSFRESTLKVVTQPGRAVNTPDIRP